jgi:hypothetical protein
MTEVSSWNCPRKSAPTEQGLHRWAKASAPPRQVWSIRVRLEMSASTRDLVLFQPRDRQQAASVRPGLPQSRGRLLRQPRSQSSIVTQLKTGRPVQFEITEATRQSIERVACSPVVQRQRLSLFQSRSRGRSHVSARKCARIVHGWIRAIGLDDRGFGTHSPRRTKVAQLYRRTGNLRPYNRCLATQRSRRPFDTFVEVHDALRLAE